MTDQSEDERRKTLNLRDFGAIPGDTTGLARSSRTAHRFSVNRADLPLPHLVRLTLGSIGCHTLGAAEKLAWECIFSFKKAACSLALEKFGLRLYISKNDIPDEGEAGIAAQQVIGKLKRSQKRFEANYLKDFAEEQIIQGQVTVRNQYNILRDTYQYFREGAELGFAGNGRRLQAVRDEEAMAASQPDDATAIPMRKVVGYYTTTFLQQREGSHNTMAMVVAYFSLLEHVLVLAAPFIGFDAAAEDLRTLIGDTWRVKFQRLFGTNTDPTAMRFHDRLHQVAEDHRNTYAHGGFDKAHATLEFHLPGGGTLPAVLSDIRSSPHFNFTPADAADLATICTLFDEVDDWLDNGKTKFAMLWIKEGLNVNYDTAFLATLGAATTTEADFQRMVGQASYERDQSENMDW